MDSLSDVKGAVDALERALKLDSRRAFAEDALARLVLAQETLGNRKACEVARNVTWPAIPTASTRNTSRAAVWRVDGGRGAGTLQVVSWCSTWFVVSLLIGTLVQVVPGVAQPSSVQPEIAVQPSADVPGSASSTESQARDGCPERYLILRSESSLNEAFAEEIRVDLAAELQRRSIGVCVTPRAEVSPLALVTLRQAEAVLSIELDDRMTQKRVQRDLSLLKVPETGRALAAAIAVG